MISNKMVILHAATPVTPQAKTDARYSSEPRWLVVTDTDESDLGMLRTLVVSWVLVLLYRVPPLPGGMTDPAEDWVGYWSAVFLLKAIDLSVSAMPATAASRLVLSRSMAVTCNVAIFWSTHGLSCAEINEILPWEVSGDTFAELKPDKFPLTLLGVNDTAEPSLQDGIEHVSQSSKGSLSSSTECAKKQSSLTHALPSVQSCVLYLLGWSQHSNTP